jgi:hypothetical protein
MFTKTFLSRAITRSMSTDHPIGDPTGGPAYGERSDPVSAIVAVGSMIASGGAAAGLLAGTVSLATVSAGLVFAGGALSLIGNVSGDKNLQKIGTVMGLAGGVGTLADALGAGAWIADNTAWTGANGMSATAAPISSADAAVQPGAAQSLNIEPLASTGPQLPTELPSTVSAAPPPAQPTLPTPSGAQTSAVPTNQIVQGVPQGSGEGLIARQLPQQVAPTPMYGTPAPPQPPSPVYPGYSQPIANAPTSAIASTATDIGARAAESPAGLTSSYAPLGKPPVAPTTPTVVAPAAPSAPSVAGAAGNLTGPPPPPKDTFLTGLMKFANANPGSAAVIGSTVAGAAGSLADVATGKSAATTDYYKANTAKIQADLDLAAKRRAQLNANQSIVNPFTVNQNAMQFAPMPNNFGANPTGLINAAKGF